MCAGGDEDGDGGDDGDSDDDGHDNGGLSGPNTIRKPIENDIYTRIGPRGGGFGLNRHRRDIRQVVGNDRVTVFIRPHITQNVLTLGFGIARVTSVWWRAKRRRKGGGGQEDHRSALYQHKTIMMNHTHHHHVSDNNSNKNKQAKARVHHENNQTVSKCAFQPRGCDSLSLFLFCFFPFSSLTLSLSLSLQPTKQQQ